MGWSDERLCAHKMVIMVFRVINTMITILDDYYGVYSWNTKITLEGADKQFFMTVHTLFYSLRTWHYDPYGDTAVLH